MLATLATQAHAINLGLVDEPQLECLALAIYWEARSGTERDQLAVAHVTMNRVQDAKFPRTVCKVVTDGGTVRHRCQFSWWCDGKSDRPEEAEAWDSAVQLAEQVLQGVTDDPTDGALFFHNRGVRPKWAGLLQRTASVGAHLFYR